LAALERTIIVGDRKIELNPLLRLVRRFSIPRKLGLFERIFGQQLAPKGVGWVSCWNGVTWILDLSDPTHRWIVYGKYEGGLGIDFARRILSGGGVYVDSGANIGQWILYLAGINGVRTLAFEPVNSERAWLEECVRGQDNWDVQIFPFGLGSKRSNAEIQCDGPRSTLRSDWYKGRGFDTQTIEIVRLTEILDASSIKKVKFWKLDVEGAELDALIGTSEYLGDRRIENIFFECHPSNYRAICNLLQENGYGIYDLSSRGLSIKKNESIYKTENLVARPIQ
jgi:FkbM family methyltransferase